MTTEARRGLLGFDDDIRKTLPHLASRVPPYARILDIVLRTLEDPVSPTSAQLGGSLEAVWSARTFHASYDRPLLLLAAIRADALREGPDHPLFAAVAGAADPQAVLPKRVLETLLDLRPALADDLRDRSVQTNETSRAVTWLWPAALAGASRGGRPLVLVDVGASAGLNLVADRLPSLWTRDGQPLPVVEAPRILRRIGVDRQPLHLDANGAADWLRACVWPTERARIERLEAAMAAFLQAREEESPPELRAGDVLDLPEVLDELVASLPGDALVLVYQSIVREYLPPEVEIEHRRGMRAFLARQPVGRAAFLELESAVDGDEQFPAAIHATFRAKNDVVETEVLARCGYHPTELRVDEDAVRWFSASMGGDD